MKTKFNGILTLLLALVVQFSFAQERSVSGVVSDQLGPISDITVLVKGTNNGIVTDFDGNYTIKAKTGDTLVFSHVSYETMEQVVGTSNTVNVMLNDAGNVLDEVVVTGYGSQVRTKLTDAIASVKNDQIKDIPDANFQSAMIGKMAGVQINQANGKAEGKVTVIIRGVASLNGSQEPLYVVDGVPILNNQESATNAPTNPLLTINANDIESVNILKDASATAIYGSRGTNGVILITTKSGKSGKGKISFSSSFGYSKATNKKGFLNATQYVELFTEASLNAGQTITQVENSLNGMRTDDNGVIRENIDTNWEDEALVNGNIREVNFSVSGGNEKSTYFMSLSSNNTEGIIKGNTLERYNFRLNASRNLSDRFKAGANVSVAKINISRVAGDRQFNTPLQAVALVPISATHNLDGSINTSTLYDNFLLEDAFDTNKTKIWDMSGLAFGEYSLTKHLNFRSEFSYQISLQNIDTFNSALNTINGGNITASAISANTTAQVANNYFTYNNTFSDIHDLNFVLGTSYEETIRKGISVFGDGFINELIQNVGGAPNITGGGSTVTNNKLLSYFARAEYSLNNKYIFKASIRSDRSSRFGPNERVGYFPAFSAGWTLSKEGFMKNSKLFSYLKVRASWGITGNQPNDSRRFESEIAQDGLFGSATATTIGLAGDPNLKWEETTQFNIGLDFGFLNNKISGEIDYYNKDTDDLLANLQTPLSQGLVGNSIFSNIGNVVNKGFEFLLKTKNVNSEHFSWSTTFNVAFNDNEIIELSGGNDINGLTTERDHSTLREGLSIGTFLLVEYAGVDPENGDALFYTNTELADGTLDRTITNDSAEAEFVAIGQALPDVVGGITNTFKYKGFDFNFTFQGQAGAQIYNSAGIFQSSGFAGGRDNQSLDQLDRWQNPGDITNVPRADRSSTLVQSTRYLQSADFVRLRNITLGYNFTNIKNIEGIRIYATGLNLLTITGYDGWDPEGTRDDVPGTGSQGRGFEFYSAPPAKVITFGFNINF